jgi:hypothetical protein
MTNRWLLIIAAVLFMVWFWENQRSQISHVPATQVQRAIVTESPAQVMPPKPQNVPPAQKATVTVLEKPKLPEEPFAGPMTTVHFKVEDGLAVAFGDQILGVPVSDDPITDGYNKPAAPKPWLRPEIPYAISPDLRNPERVELALQHLRENTVVNFIPLTNQKDGIVFESGEANCKSYLGRIGGLQPIKLSIQCGWVEIVHEVMHSLGFIHEHSRTDRDQYVEVVWENVQDEFKSQFAMVPSDLMILVKGFPFDYHSVMLYPPNLFAKISTEPTLKPKRDEPVAPSDRGLSQHDIERINQLFR